MIEAVDMVHVHETLKVPVRTLIMMKCILFPNIEGGCAYLPRSSEYEEKLQS
jgi:hypothetical protein